MSEFDDMRANLISLMREITGLAREVNYEDRLIDDLALNSIDFVEIRALLRSRWSVDLSGTEIGACDTFRDLLLVCHDKRRE